MLYFYVNIFSEFQCQMCGTCCKNDWMVTVDQDCYQRNADLFSRAGRTDEFHAAFLPINSSCLGEYALIAKQPQGKCWFLQPDHLCRLHKEAGHEHLDVVCKTFPRYPMDTARGVELTLNFSCPRVVTLASQSVLEIIRSEEKPTGIYSDHFVTHVYPQQHSTAKALHYYFELEQHFIDILQWRSLRLSERIEIICNSAAVLCSQKPIDMGSEITRLISSNYERLQAADSGVLSQDAADILLENYFVNIVFKKLFYDHGLQNGAVILQLFWQHIQDVVAQDNKKTERWDQVYQAIAEIEFEYCHHRSQFTKRLIATNSNINR